MYVVSFWYLCHSIISSLSVILYWVENDLWISSKHVLINRNYKTCKFCDLLLIHISIYHLSSICDVSEVEVQCTCISGPCSVCDFCWQLSSNHSVLELRTASNSQKCDICRPLCWQVYFWWPLYSPVTVLEGRRQNGS